MVLLLAPLLIRRSQVQYALYYNKSMHTDNGFGLELEYIVWMHIELGSGVLLSWIEPLPKMSTRVQKIMFQPIVILSFLT